MGEVSVDQAVNLISSGRLKDRIDGLEDLKHILLQNRRSPRLASLNDKVYHSIFETLFRFIAIEKSTFSKANRAVSKTQAASRLAKCAGVIRTAAEVSLRCLRTKTVVALINHVIDSLSVTAEGLWEPLSADYIKTLRVILQYPPHVEHLSKDIWCDVLDFCLRGLGLTKDNSQLQMSIRRGRSIPPEELSQSTRSSPHPTSISSSYPSTKQDSRGSSEDFELCIQLLVSCPGMPVLENAPKLFHNLSKYIASLNPMGSTPHAAFSALNTTLSIAILENITLVQDTLCDVIPTIRRYWSTKSAVLKEEMLATLLLGKEILCRRGQALQPELDIEIIQAIVDRLQSEYIRLPEREILQVDDLIFSLNHVSKQVGLHFISPNTGVSKVIQNWTILSLIAAFSRFIDDYYSREKRGLTAEKYLNKKQHLLSRTDDILRDASRPSGNSRICALQLIPFIISEAELEAGTLSTLLGQLIKNILDDNIVVASWSIVAIASLTSCENAKSDQLKGIWLQAWELSVRNISSPTISRAVCHLMAVSIRSKLLNYSDIARTLDSLVSSADLNGPANLNDSSLNLWINVLEQWSDINVAQSQSLAKQACGWLKNKWVLVPTDRAQTNHMAVFARPLPLLSILLSCSGTSIPNLDLSFINPANRISKIWTRLQHDSKTLNYLMLTDKNMSLPSKSLDAVPVYAATRHLPSETLVLDLLQNKIDTFHQVWVALCTDKGHHITTEIIQILTSLCIISIILMEFISPQSARCQNIQDSVNKLWASLCDKFGKDEEHLNTCLEVLAPMVLSLEAPFDSKDIMLRGIVKVSVLLIPIMERRRHSDESNSQASDAMDIDTDFPSHQPATIESSLISKELRRDNVAPLFPDSTSIRIATSIQLTVLHKIQLAGEPCLPLDDELIGYLTTLTETDILVGWKYVIDILRGRPDISRANACRVIEHFGEKCLESYELEGCESTICACISLMSCFVNLWTGNERDNLFESASELYAWFTEVLLGEGLGSSKILIRLADLSEAILRANPSHLKETRQASPRTTLFRILRDGDLAVKFHISQLIPDIFSRFVLKEHDAILEDVIDRLPQDSTWIEGIALRLYLFAQLASRWHTLLRQSIYRIFETSGNVPTSIPHAKACLQEISTELNLNGPKEVFQLFTPQILYTWMDKESVTDIPFAVFGYPTLHELLLDIQDEVVGQTAMREKEDDKKAIEACLERKFEDLLYESFYKAEAYSVARDISIPPSQEAGAKGAERGMINLLGKEKFFQLSEQYFPQTVATLFGSIDQTEQIQRAFEKRPLFHHALKAWQHIHARSHSTSALPLSQQPCFRARYLLDEIEVLCKRSGFDIETMWTPSLVCFVARMLLDSTHPALGSLHTCSVIRKLKILICVAGQISLYDYPFEMLLRGLSPFLTDFHCAEDAIGLVWYLIENGKAYLTDNPSFTAGLAVSILASLREFLSAPQASTTQRAHFKATLSKAHEFHLWFSDFLKTYSPSTEYSTLDGPSTESLRRIIHASQNIQLVGNGIKGTYESELILELLGDKISGRNLLTTHTSNLVLSQLCGNFQRPASFRDDVLGEDDDAASHAMTLWSSVENRTLGKGFRLWLARVLGRAYAATGVVNPSFRKEQKSEFLDYSRDGFLAGSKIAILRILCNTLPNNSEPAGLAERTLQVIANNLAKDPLADECMQIIPSTLLKALTWEPYKCPMLVFSTSRMAPFLYLPQWDVINTASRFAQHLALFLCNKVAHDAVIGTLPKIILEVPSFAVQLLPYILHDVLLSEIDGNQKTRNEVSELFKEAFQNNSDSIIPHICLIVTCILYLRRQPLPRENTMSERNGWLDIDFMLAATAASRCQMYKTSLLFFEICHSQAVGASRRSSTVATSEPTELLHCIFKNIDDPDSFYGIQQDQSLDAVLKKLEHESSGLKNLFFQSANFDTDLRLGQDVDEGGAFEMIKALNFTNLQGLSNSMFRSCTPARAGNEAFDYMLSTNIYLQQWDIPVPTTTSPAGTLFKSLQALNSLEDRVQIIKSLDDCFLEIIDRLNQGNQSLSSLKSSMTVLGILTEIDEIIVSDDSSHLHEAWDRLTTRGEWLKSESFQDISQILISREAIFSSISRQPHLKKMTNLSSRDAQILEAKCIRESLRISREHDIPQASLQSAMSLSKLVQPCAELGVKIDAATAFDLANVLWDQGEMKTSIKILQSLSSQKGVHDQTIPVSVAEVLASLGHHIAEARLEQPDAIIQSYLVPSIKELKGENTGKEAGLVFHQFATFCDQQLQNPDTLEDFVRLERLRSRKLKEVTDLEDMMKTSDGKTKDQLRSHRTKAKQWFDLDDREYQRLKKSRESFLCQCLENYLLSLTACDTFTNDVLRFCALWLDNSDNEQANNAVSKYLCEVPTRKFASLMNQLSSRLLDVADTFQPLLSSLVLRICVDHPYHGMYHLFVNSRSKKDNDPKAVSRYNAAGKIVDILKKSKRSGEWLAIHNTSYHYLNFAAEPLDGKVKSGSKLVLKKTIYGTRMQSAISNTKIPPPTMTIPLRADCDYSKVPHLVNFQPTFTIASGISAPKIVTAMASDGVRYKQLFKSGNDDLRQDAIMEQTFEQVSDLLQDHRETRQRKLGIRTYKVLPLASNSGIIEFVQNTMPLNDYLLPAHQRYFPRDFKPNQCRKFINDAQSKSRDQRIKAYRHVTDHFHPVMKYFFMEKFPNPDDWFSKRLAYTRSTAAISMLGHVLGLGDRHGHNILLDTETGEAVHIDLGVAFEQGRVLPIPESVPFRLTRDLVDGMGYTKTEGVFRRSCEFTLEALREESYSIMTILDVLRYDPLYSWTLSPLRMKKMQDAQEAENGAVTPNEGGKKSNLNEPNEADRALTVVRKKLGKSLSVAATVNELIQQATDEKNLAVLYCGWAAYV
ncbi:ataxia telangiectasia mutated [Nannizzia gypsea CBS 118893]|uniref:Serine/threonine-protein kinase Tel1 n=1 Tax=Arthroderma gypseum (strain ATCC MYA-4604 / CBS 118893) TaxID=535722 RepID=E4V3Q3_ARTGP|nr:ataxia telangiectasia mutated [Nannizzia gypsea CBS 118893]EFR04627.1 ataxia telangiectasia mutated [Nannizzia gypsea CBS 118893]